MATSTFDRKIEISTPEALKRLINVMNSEAPKPLSTHPFSTEERKRGELLLKQCRLRSPR